jgi:anti-sigma factor RsiW
MTCRDVADFMLDYASGELAADTRAIFDHHLARCTNCRAYLALYLKAIEMGREAFADGDALAVSAGVPDELVAAILAARL